MKYETKDSGRRAEFSSWTQTNGVVYNTGQVQLLNTIDGKWKGL